ncbi:alpha/beta hydrolase family protein [Roseivivax sp. CAU 1753]
MAKLNLLDAAELIRDAYANNLGDRLHTTIDIRGVQAFYLKDRTLVIPGTNEFSDWFDYNLRFGHYDTPGHGFDVVPGDSGTLWHAGFLAHAQIVYTFAKGLRPKFIVGHSLGAASAQIVGASLAKPTIAFASPKTCQSRQRMPGEGWVVNICRIDDTVCHVPPAFLGFRTIGSHYWLTPTEADPGEQHRIENYTELLSQARVKSRVPTSWPR